MKNPSGEKPVTKRELDRRIKELRAELTSLARCVTGIFDMIGERFELHNDEIWEIQAVLGLPKRRVKPRRKNEK